MARNLWVVEAVDRRLRDLGLPYILGEALIDPTANQYPSPKEPGIVAAHAPGLLWTITPDSKNENAKGASTSIYASGRPKYLVCIAAADPVGPGLVELEKPAARRESALLEGGGHR